MKIKSLLKHNLMRAAMTLALILACATAWAQTTQSVTYIDENGQTQTVTATVLTSNESSLGSDGTTTWYVVNSNITHSGRINYRGNVNIILADGCTMTTSTDNGDGIHGYSSSTLTIYGQTLGTGTLAATGGGAGNPSIYSSDGDIIINGGTVTVTATSPGTPCISIGNGSFTINGGTVTATATGSSSVGIFGGTVTINGGTVTASGTSTGISAHWGSGTITLGWTNTTDCIHASSYSGTVNIADGKALKNGGTVYYGTLTAAQKSAIANVTLQPATQAEFIAAALPQTGTNEYTIYDSVGWNAFCLALDDNATWNRFSGKTVKLGANITVTQMAGGSQHDFTGTFDGDGKTLTVSYGSADEPINAQYVAPFLYTTDNNGSMPKFRNLTIDGNIYEAYTGSEEHHHVGGLIGHLYGTVTIEHCTSNVTITSTGGAGGFVGLCENAVSFNDCVSSAVIHSAGGSNGGFIGWSRSSNYTISFAGCVFNGKLLKVNGNGKDNGGFIGWKGDLKTVVITNCLVDPAPLCEGETMADGNSATFSRQHSNYAAIITNCYYTRTLGTAQGKQARSITAGNYVTVENAGTATTYSTSGITSYGTGIKYNNVLYAGSGETVSLTLGITVPEDYFLGYSASPTEATLSGSGNPYTLTMPDADVVITANTSFPTVSYIDENGETQQRTDYIWLTGTETTLGAAGQETWCVVQGTLNYSHGIQLLGNTHIILCDGAAMNIGTSDNPVSGTSYQENVGFYGGETFNLSLYAQSGNTGTLTIYSQWCSFDVKDLTIAGGNLNATTITTSPVIGCSNNLTVRRSALEIHTNGPAVQANGDVALSNVTANINSSNNVGFSCSNFAVDNSQLTVNTRAEAIVANNGIITLSNVTANLNSSNAFGLVCSNFTVDNSQLTVTAPNPAIRASVITLGCTAATDFIKATNTSSLTGSYSGTVKIADGQTLYDGANAYTGTLTDAERQTIGGRKLTNVAPPTYDYIGLDGTGATHTAVVIDADNMPTALSGWYIVQGTVNYTNTINLGGDTHIILADNAVMNVTASEGNYGIQSTSGNNYSLFVYGQTGQSGELNVTSDRFACYIIYGGDITIAGGKVTASGTMGIHAQYNNNGGNVTIKNATVTATGTSYFGILSEYGGNITIDNSNVTATSTGSSGIYAENGNITIASGTVTASGSSTQFGIYTVYGSVTINGGQVTTTGSIGIYTVYGSVTINGGQVMATGNIYGIYAQNSSDNITLGWTNPTDYIYANKYYAGGTLSIAEGKTFIDEDGQTYSGTIAQADGAYPIDGKTLYPYSENAVPYLDENGQQRYCIAYTTLTGTETSLGTAGQETWYVVDSDVSFTDLTINGDIHLILVDGKTMNLYHEQGFVTLWGQANLTIYGQTNGTGTLSSLGLISTMNITVNGGIVNVKGDGFFKEENFIPAIWCVGDMVINGGKVYAQGDMGIVVASMGAKSDDMTTYNFTLNGGQVTAIGMSTDMGIIATGNITLGWTNPTDYIYANSYYAEDTLSIASGKTFIDDDGNPYSGIIAQVAGAYAIDGKTLYPDCVVMKQVAGYEEGNGGWVFIASPVAGSIAPSEVHNLFPSADETTDDYDLYHFNQAAELEWENWKATATGNDPDFTTLVNGQGYLYATKNTKTLVFTGPFITDAESVAVGLEYDATDDHKCWNLVGNPFADTAYVDHDFYVMNALGSEIIAAERDYVNPMEGIFVKAEGEYDDTMIFSLQAPCKGQSSKPKHEQMVINLSRDRGPSTLRVASGTAGSGTTIIDRAIVRMGEGQTQPKFQINRNSTKLYIPQGGTDYAIITSNGQGELPLNFKAETDGTYTLSFNAEEVGFSYLHLIDNMTGADVDLLPLLREQGGLNQPATYTFTAKTTDYESRFKLVFFRP